MLESQSRALKSQIIA